VLKPLSTGCEARQKTRIDHALNGFELALAWAGSPAAMASDPFCFVILDEVDKYESQTKQADPVGEARVRIRTYERSRREDHRRARRAPKTGRSR
jgi:phage terminase large subunit GpA-like protein